MTFVIFTVSAAATTFVWNRLYRRVPLRVAAVFWLIVVGYQSQTLFSSRVDLPGNLAYHAYPWRALNRRAVHANTGIVFTQLAPWTEAARDALRHGELPLWNRYAAAGTPLLANQQTALLHPFTLLGFLLPLGKAFTLTACLRLFFVLFFTFVLLRQWNLTVPAAMYGSVAYSFCTFHIVWLLFPLGLATMMFPLVLVGIGELLARRTVLAALPLIAGTAMTLFGGHPESAAWVLLTGFAYGIYCAFVQHEKPAATLVAMSGAIAAGIGIAAVFWYPTVRILPFTNRRVLVDAWRNTRQAHHYTTEWFLPLLAPNILGTSPSGTYRAPQPSNPGILDDYGEIASGYAGALSLGLALVALTRIRERPRLFLAATAVFALLTVMEVPGWHTLLQRAPVIGLTIFGRVRFLLAFAIAMLAACGVDDWLRQRASSLRVISCIAIGCAMVSLAYVARLAPETALRNIQQQHAVVVACVALAAFLVVIRASERRAVVLIAVVFAELAFVTYRYNPSARRADVFPETGAIAFLRHVRPWRMATVGWSFLAETPSYYAIEDVKTTDPIANPSYLRVLESFTKPGDYDQLIENFDHPFLNALGVRYLYLPPDQHLSRPWFREVYRGPDGSVLDNTKALPRYRSDDASVRVRVTRYTSNETELLVKGPRASLITTSDVAWPGWTASWNGHPLSMTKVNDTFVGVIVPGGDGVVRLRYSSPGLIAGAALSGATIVVVMLAMIVEKRRVAVTPTAED